MVVLQPSVVTMVTDSLVVLLVGFVLMAPGVVHQQAVASKVCMGVKIHSQGLKVCLPQL